ncbi:hypothetical protein AGLY_012235 [Aphis glycines]|uniref:Uncharacterized protein n=1 Tax=Aphis glycines TaxID=307491 RepID=A0A6G0T9I4_APHGL|nr:hypothetical protein AGLY_012235 [Aphis glycines]
MDFENSFIPIWEESPEVYYEPVILEKKLDKIEKEFDEIQYKCSELEKENEILRTEIKTKEKENTDLNNLFKGNTAKLPFYQSKIVELTKEIKELNFDKKNEVMVKDILKKKYEEMKKKTIETVESYMALKTAYKNQEKINEKLKIEKKQDIKNKDRIKAENDKAKTKTDELQIQNKGFKEQLNHYEEELRSKNIMIIELTRRNQILESNIENALTKTNNLEEKVKFLEKKIKTMNKECSESIIKHKSLLYELNALKEKLNDSDELRTTMEGMRGNERSLNKKINTCLQMLAAAKVENEKLIEIAHQLEKKKTRSVCVREDIAPIKRDLQECMTKNMELINKFSSLTERHYENKIFALEQKIKTLHSEINRRDEEHLKYRDVVIKCLYDSKAAKDKLKTTNTLLEKQKYEIIYDKLDVLDKDSKIKKLKIQKNNLDNHLKLYNKQSTLLCKKNRDHILKIESMKKGTYYLNP